MGLELKFYLDLQFKQNFNVGTLMKKQQEQSITSIHDALEMETWISGKQNISQSGHILTEELQKWARSLRNLREQSKNCQRFYSLIGKQKKSMRCYLM